MSHCADDGSHSHERHHGQSESTVMLESIHRRWMLGTLLAWLSGCHASLTGQAMIFLTTRKEMPAMSAA